tara:strand:+ start:116 stop:436 length:321 start_codon:yes stop_codon:yes gene_type:complete
MRKKYKNIKTNGYDSKKEYKRSLQLKQLQKEGKISNLEEQKVFVLQESFKNNQNKTIRSISYIIDYFYIENGVEVAEDVKGFKTDVYKIKAKLFQKKYSNIKFIET